MDQWGVAGRPPPVVRATRQKLGRDGLYHTVFADEEPDPPEVDEGDGAWPPDGDLTDAALAALVPLAEPFPNWIEKAEVRRARARSLVRGAIKRDEK